VFTPKSLLRHPRCVSTLGELAEGRFQEVLDDPAAERGRVRRIVLTSGKLYYDLLKAREDKRADGLALVRLEQIYPFPTGPLSRVLERYPRSAELVWAQEEPQNMGAWRFIRERFLDEGVPGASDRLPRYIGRPPSASPAAGSYKLHLQEQEAILEDALGVGSAAGVVPTAQPAPAAS
jgi:2-oxoglutarate dehydrogenase E1 component